MRLREKAAPLAALWLCAVTLLVTSCSGAAPRPAGQDGAPENHFVIMYDMSPSMKNADDRLKGMVADFLVKVPTRLMPYKIAVIPFAGRCPQTDALENGGTDWWEIQTGNGEAKQKIKNALSELGYEPFTNIEEALRTCAETLAAMREDSGACSQTVLFITDGLIDLPGGQSRIDDIIASGKRVPDIAGDFPDDCKFWAIMPDEDTKNTFVTYDGDGNVLTYNGTKVGSGQQEGIRAVFTCLEDFCSRLNELGREGMGTRAGTISMDWTKDTLQNFKGAYTEFFESIWDTTTVTREQVELDAGFEFAVPEGTAEVNITVMPEIEDPARCRQAARRLAEDGALFVTRDGAPQRADCSGSIYTVNVKLINPPAGTYCLQTSIKEECRFTLDFLTYSDLKISVDKQSVTKALGSTVVLEGSVVDSTGKQITGRTACGLTMEAWVSAEPGGDGNRAAVELDEGRFQCGVTASRVGDSFLTLHLVYDDTDQPQIPGGVSKFGRQETITITVPEVSYAGGAARRFPTGIALELRPYSELPEGRADVPAEAAKKYLNDDWAVRLLDEQGAETGPDIPMELSEDGTCFVLECGGAGAKTAVMLNRTTGETVEVPIPGAHLLILLVGAGAAVLIAAVAVVVFILLAQRKITVSIRWNGETTVLYLSGNGSPQSGVLGGEPVTAQFEKENKQVAARLDGRTKRVDVVGHSCDIDF